MANDLGQYRVGREGKNVMFLPPPKVPEGTFLLDWVCQMGRI
jgi:hypothetical protein